MNNGTLNDLHLHIIIIIIIKFITKKEVKDVKLIRSDRLPVGMIYFIMIRSEMNMNELSKDGGNPMLVQSGLVTFFCIEKDTVIGMET